jgi:DNA-binding MarR family transcriptional regulator
MANKVNKIDPSREAQLNRASELFLFAYRAFTKGPDRILEGHGLQRVHHRILYFVGRHPGISVNGLLSVLGVTKQALNAPLRQLLEMGLVDSLVSGDDRRVRELRLTSAGARLESSLSGGQRRLMEGIFQELGPEAEDAWRTVMERIAASGA